MLSYSIDYECEAITSLLLTFFLYKGDCLWLVLGDHLNNAHKMQIHSH